MSRFLRSAVLVCISAAPVFAGPLGLGRAALPDEISAWDIDIRPDGAGLPPGRGSVTDGEELYAGLCASCHGDFGEGVGRWPILAGGEGTLADERPVKTVGSYWPFLSTAWDYIYRTMPYGNAQSLAPDEVYGLTAYVLYLNDLVDDDFVLSKDNLAEFEMPNVGAFRLDDRPETEYPEFRAPACMERCKARVKITGTGNVDGEKIE